MQKDNRLYQLAENVLKNSVKLKKGDKLIFTAFGAGFAWGAVYVKWGYDGKKLS